MVEKTDRSFRKAIPQPLQQSDNQLGIITCHFDLSFLGCRETEQNYGVTALTEFSFLAAQAQALGVQVPTTRRLSLTLRDGRTVSAVAFGEGDPVITFLHGAGLNAHTWDATILALGVPALAIDLPGHGDSSWREDLNYTAGALAPDIAEALESWATGPQLIVGHSLGGLTAARLAAQHPELVLGLIIVDITPGIDTSNGPAILREFYAGPTDFASRDDLVDRALAFGFGGSRANTERGVFLNTRVRDDGRVEWKHHFAHLAASTFADPSTPLSSEAATRILSDEGWADLSAVDAPITLVRAEQGFVSEKDTEEYVERVPGSSIIALPAPHNVQETSPVELAEIIKTRLSAASAPKN